MFRKSFVFTLIIVSILAVGVYGATAQEPQLAGNGGCEAGNEYDPSCDVNRDGDMTVEDLSLVANHWGQAGVWTAAGDFWQLDGNANITDPATQYLGTMDGQDLVINPNGGNVGIGTTSPDGTLEVVSGLDVPQIAAGDESFRLTMKTRQQGIQGTEIRLTGPPDLDGVMGFFVPHGGLEINPLTFNAGDIFFKGDAHFTDGRVGIGTTSPDGTLEVNSSGPDVPQIVSGDSAYTLSVRTLQPVTGTEFKTIGPGPTVMAFQVLKNAQTVKTPLTLNAGNAYFKELVYFREGNDAALTTGTGYLVIGSESSDNIVIDDNEIMARQNGNTANLILNKVGGNVGIGTTDPQTKLHVAGRTKTSVLEITGGSDLAEPFEIAGPDKVEPGMVVAIDPAHPGQLRIADQAYDRTVAGCVSGAGGVNPGMIMQQEGSVAAGSFPVALSGRVYCWADASYGAIQAGDLLTTSDTPGHPMKATDHDKAQGAVIGKAMSALEEGKGLVLILVMPQ